MGLPCVGTLDTHLGVIILAALRHKHVSIQALAIKEVIHARERSLALEAGI